jgi:hypothetical protein
MTDPLPCPFCGGQAQLRLDDYINGRCISDPMAYISCENPDCGVWPEAEGKYNTERDKMIAAWNTRAPLPDEAAARIEGLEAEVERLKAGTDQLGRMWEANQDLLAESKEIDFQFDEMKRLTAENARLRMILAALDAYALGEPSQPPVTGVKKQNINLGELRRRTYD